MGDSDDSSKEGKSSSKSSSKSSKKSRQSSEAARKKKIRRKGSNGATSDTEPTSDNEGIKKKNATGRRKTSRSKKNNPEAPMKDSMLVKINKKREAKNNGMGGKPELNRDVSFSRSTLQRDQVGLSSLDLAMGKIPPPVSTANSNDHDDHDGDNDDDSPSPTRRRNSALRPSKYGDGDGKKAIGFATEDDQPKKKIGFANFSEDEPKNTEITATSDRRARPRFRTVDYGSEDDSDIGRRQPQRRSISMSNLTGSSQQTGMDNPQSMNGEKPSWQPDRINSSVAEKRKRRATPDSNDDEMKSSLTAQRPGIQRRNSMGSITTSRRFTSEQLAEDGNEELTQRNTFSRAAQSVHQINSHKQIRRLKMSVEHQTYIPPKSRQASVFQAITHLMTGQLVDLTLWTYQASFAKVLLFFMAFYVGNIFLWAAVMDGVDLASGGHCIHEDPESLSRSDRYEYVFELSWATFTTVGYGTISPQGDMTGCYPIRFTCAFVAFFGVIFASQTAAIMYSKLMRLLAKAHVTFSSTLCIQYGKGNEGSTVRFGQLNFRASVAPALMKKFSASDLLNDSDDEDSPSGSEDGFPIIEFRMINDRANYEGSEIWDAQIRGIVQLHKEESPEKNGFVDNLMKDKSTGGESTLDLEKKVYYPILLSPDTHPHFSRIWYARHILNAESPLLKREIRDMIVKEGGKWDKDFNNWEEIRDCLNAFISLRITLSGTSAVSASTVYGEHVYGFDDVCVGWRFANMVYEKKERVYTSWLRSFGYGRAQKEDEEENHETSDMRTKIDAALLHDIVPQPGGDHEPLNESKQH